jgi:hypothetical protein
MLTVTVNRIANRAQHICKLVAAMMMGNICHDSLRKCATSANRCTGQGQLVQRMEFNCI